MNKLFLFGALLLLSACVIPKSEITRTKVGEVNYDGKAYPAYEVTTATTYVESGLGPEEEKRKRAEQVPTYTRAYVVEVNGMALECPSLKKCPEAVAEKLGLPKTRPVLPAEPVGAEN